MAQKQKNKNKKWITPLIIVVFFVAIAVVVYFVWSNNNRKSDENNDNSQVENSSSEQKSDTEENEKPKVVQYDGDNPNTLDELSGVVTYAGVVDDKVMIRVNIDQYLENGSCNLVLSRGGSQLYNGDVNIISNVSTATCEGFDVPVSGLGQGKTDIIINIESNGKTGVIRSEVDI